MPKRSRPKSAQPKSSRKLGQRQDVAPDAQAANSRFRDASEKPSAKAKARRPARKTFLVAATLPDGTATPHLRVFAAVKRSPAEALAAVKESLGADITVELTGKLSNRMARTLGLKLDEIRQI